MAKSPAFQFYPDSWLSSQSITLMSPAEEGAYIRLLCHAWLAPDCGLPADSESLKVLSRLGSGWNRSESRIRAKFTERDDRLFNDRLIEERNKQEVWRQKSSYGGSKSAATKQQAKLKGGSRVVEECLQPNLNIPSPSSFPSLVTTETIPVEIPRRSPIEAWFEDEFWPIWVRRAEDDLPSTALKAAKVVARTVALRQQILLAAKSCRAERLAKDPTYRASARRWFRDGMWKDAGKSTPPPEPAFSERPQAWVDDFGLEQEEFLRSQCQ